MKWNTGQDWVEINLNQHELLNIWAGGASRQCVPNHNCILTGGGNQVWVDQKEIRQFKLVRKKKVW